MHTKRCRIADSQHVFIWICQCHWFVRAGFCVLKWMQYWLGYVSFWSDLHLFCRLKCAVMIGSSYVTVVMRYSWKKHGRNTIIRYKTMDFWHDKEYSSQIQIEGILHHKFDKPKKEVPMEFNNGKNYLYNFLIHKMITLKNRMKEKK